MKPTPSFFNATVKKQLMQVIDTYAQQQSVATRKTLANNKPVREALSTMGTISPRSIAEFNKQCGDLTIDSDSQKIMAPAVPEMQYAQNEVRQQIALNEDDKLTIFKAAQKGVEVINNKTGTNIAIVWTKESNICNTLLFNYKKH
jgi:vacuolar-type H+-ATPase subunit D/Vma8